MLTSSLGLDRDVVDLGPFADTRTALQASRAVLFQPTVAGRKMDLPMVLLEALGSGRPVLVSDVCALPELGDGSGAVMVAAPGSALAEERMLRLLLSAAAGETASLEARRLAERRYATERMVATYAALYERVLGRELRRRAALDTRVPEVAG
jgi:glycosyltransferase involved in cell wall biosynthesis